VDNLHHNSASVQIVGFVDIAFVHPVGSFYTVAVHTAVVDAVAVVDTVAVHTVVVDSCLWI
jgi:hypothetical protein